MNPSGVKESAMSQFTAPRPQLSLQGRKPRNPMVAPALLRQAGRHQAQRAAERQRAKQDLALEIRRLRPDERSP